MYTTRDYHDEIIKAIFYEPELQVINSPKVYRIQEILKSKGDDKYKQYYVKWHGYSNPTWINSTDLI